MDQEQDTLVFKAKQGDANSMAQLVERHRLPLLAFINRKLSDGLKRKVEPEDILQEVSIHAFQAVNDIELDDKDYYSWLCQIAQRRIIDAHRRYFGAQKRSAEREVGLYSPSGDGAEKGLIDILAVSITTASQVLSRQVKELRLQKAMEGLPEDARNALHLRYVEGLPTKEIAERIGKSHGAIRVLLTRTISRLQKQLNDDAEEAQ